MLLNTLKMRTALPPSRHWRAAPSVARKRYTTETPPATLSTFSNQGILPRLPIPTLEATATRYLRSLKPLLSDAEYRQSEKAVAAFISSDGMGPVLQRRLQETDKSASHSWLEDIWLNKAYLEWREPNYINVNWFACVADNPTIPIDPAPISGQPTAAQVSRAARLIVHALEFNDTINAQTLPAEVHRGTAMCMNQYKWQFGTSRIPRPGRDQIVGQYPSTARHILLMYKDATVSVPVYNSGGARASLAQIMAQITDAIQKVDEQIARRGRRSASVAQLTAGHRDDWTNARLLLEQDSANRDSFAQVDSALFGVCLDVDVDPHALEDAEACARLFCHSDAGRNRWYDKAFQFIVLNNGRAGVNGEHAPVDALTTGHIAMDAVMKERVLYKDSAPCKDLSSPSLIQWNVGASVPEIIDKVRGDARALSGNLNVCLGNMREYGTKWIKSLGVSPDAYFQTALQAAYFRHHGRPAPTYETASLRAFLHGRTETIRSCTEESLAFAKAFGDRDLAVKRKLELFERSVRTHVEHTKLAASGNGVDRHLLGLRAHIGSPEEAERCSLFVDPAYIKSMSFALSTSNVSPGELFRGGFAPVIPDGYGLNYALDKADLKFTLSDWASSNETDSRALRQTIYDTLGELHEIGEYAIRNK